VEGCITTSDHTRPVISQGRFFGPNDFLRKQIKAKRKNRERRNLPEQLDFDLPLRI
jgi:hypothetical protein